MKRVIPVLILFACLAFLPLLTAARTVPGLSFGDKQGEIASLNKRSKVLRSDSAGASLAYAFRALDLARGGHDLKGEAEACQNLGKTYLVLGQYQQALTYFDLSERLTRQLRQPDDPIVAECIACCFQAIGKNEQAVAYFLKSLELSKEQGIEKQRYNPYVSLARIYAEWGWDDHALDYYNNALEIQIGENDSAAAAYTLTNMAGIYCKALGNEKGPDYYRQSLRIFKKLRNFRGIGYVLNSIGIYYKAVSKYDSAKISFIEAISNYEKIGFYEGMSFAYNNLGEVFLKEDNLSQAQGCFNRSLQLADSSKSEIARCTSLTSLGNIYLRTGQPVRALPALNQSLAIAISLNFKESMADNYLALSSLYKQKGDWRQALKYGELYVETRDSLFRETSQKVVAEMQARFEAVKKERQIVLLTKENEISKLAIRSRERITIISTISAGVLLVLLVLLVRFYYLRQRAYTNYVKLSVDHIRKEQKPVSKDSQSGSQELIDSLSRIMSAEKSFLDPGLTLADVAQKLNTNTSYLSKAINDLLNKNFSAYINELRIHEAQIMLSDKKFSKLSIEGIALSSGFNSKSAFNTAFKKFTGVTPSFFQKSALKNQAGKPPA